MHPLGEGTEIEPITARSSHLRVAAIASSVVGNGRLFMIVVVVEEALAVEFGKRREWFLRFTSNHDNCPNLYQAMKIA
jgi:hypothetical protein